MRVIQEPISEMLCPPKNSLKFLCRKARHVCDAPLRPRHFTAASGAGEPVRFVSSVGLNLREILLRHLAGGFLYFKLEGPQA